MLRLALIGVSLEPARLSRLAARLRGARIVAVAEGEAPPADTWDAAWIGQPTLTPLCQQLARAGKPLLVSSPLAADAAEARALISACREAGVRLMFGQAARYLPSVRAVKEALDANKLGQLGLLRIHRWEPPDDAPSWQLLIREIDLACWLFGRAPASVFALERRIAAVGIEPDFLQLHLGFGGGVSALIDLARTLPPGDRYYSLSVIGATGAAYADDHRDRQLLFGRGYPAAIATEPGDAYLAALVQEFVDALSGGREPAATGAEGLRALEVAEACWLAARSG